MMEELIRILTDTTKVLNDSLPLEKEKLKAVQEDRISALEECMMKEQAIALKMKGLEQKRETFMEEHGYSGMTLKEIIEKTEGDDRSKMQALLDEIVLAAQNFSSYSDEAMKLIQLKQHTLEKASLADGGRTYGKDAQSIETDHLLSRLL